MKKTTLLSYVIGVFLLVSNALNGQTAAQRERIMSSYNQEQLAQLAQTFSKAFTQDLARARLYAKYNNIPLTLKQENGEMAVLHKVLEDGTLLYTGTHNKGASVTVKADKLYPNSISGLGLSLEGEGMIIGVWDGGTVLATHELLGQNRINQFDQGSLGLSNHATHVTGTLIGADIGDGLARGVAYKASAQMNDYDYDLSEMINQAASGLLISNHSYGYKSEKFPLYYFGRYDQKTAALDQILFYTPYYTVVSSAGNNRNVDPPINVTDYGYDLLSDMAVAKNNITVAAVDQVDTYVDATSVVMSLFSSFGPTDDGRIKPDISAKGVKTYSSVSSGTSDYEYFSGTSMAAPNVTGALTLLQELYSNTHDNFMKAATLKALAIHTTSETGPEPGPDYQFGWGLLDAEAAAKVILKQDYQTKIEEHNLASGATFTKSITALETEPLVVTIVWTDPEAEVQGNVVDDPTPRLVNDLDVELVNALGNVTYPWKLDGANFTNAATKGVNNVDNVEKIEITAPSGNYTVRVTHKGALLYGTQDFSLIISGISESSFVLTPDQTNKIFCSNDIALYKFNYESNAAYNGPTVLSAVGLPTNAIATFSPSIITADEDFTLEISGLDQITPGHYNFEIIAKGPSLTKTKEMNLRVDSALPLSDTSLISPGNNATDTYIKPLLEWSAVVNATDYKVEVSTMSDFNSKVFEGFTSLTSIELPGLDSNTQYFWRVKPLTHCSEGTYSSSSFTTEALGCSGDSFSAIDLPITIPLTAIEITSVITVAKDVVIGDIDVSINATHSYVGDMTISLISPAGTEVVLINGKCFDGNNIDVTFDDSGDAFSCGTITAITGSKRPEESLGTFVGENAVGDWKLKVSDPYNGDGGTLNNFSLQICSSVGVLGAKTAMIEGFTLYPNPANRYFEFSLNNQQEDVQLGVYDINGRLLIKKSFNLQTPKRMDVNLLSSGVYFVEIINGSQKGTKKLIVN